MASCEEYSTSSQCVIVDRASSQVVEMYSTSAALLCFLITLGVVCCDGDKYYIGVGRYDVTGPAVETEMVSLLIVCTRTGYRVPAHCMNRV